jgi:hypothetical protein
MTSFSRKIIEEGVQQHLSDWIVPWLAQIEREQELAPKTIATPRSWDTRTDFTRNPEDTLPMIAVISTGTNGQRPRQDGDGRITAWWLVAVGAVVAASSHQDANDLAGYYGTAIRQAMTLQDLDWANGIEWTDEQYDDLPVLESRNLAVVREVFTVEIPEVINRFEGGFLLPPDDPYEGGPDPEPPITKKVIDSVSLLDLEEA